MKNCVFLLLLLGFIRVIFSCSETQGNHTEDVCTVAWFRRKRANADYTRWRFNTETTPKFILKVLDDEVQVPTTKRLAAVNILPVTKRAEKIIVGGAMVPPVTTTSKALPRDYTRFMPPTAKAKGESLKTVLPYVTTLEIPSDYIQPIQPDQSSHKKVIQPPFLPPIPARNAFRDESPPGSPQFLQRTHVPELVPSRRQYAAVAPVAFTRLTTGSTPFKPPLYGLDETELTRSTESGPTRTKNFLEKISNMEDFPVLEAIVEHRPENENLIGTRTTLKEAPRQTELYTTAGLFDDQIEHIHTTDIQKYLENEFNNLDENDITNQRRNKNPNYDNDLFYNADYKSNKRNEISLDGKNYYEDSVKVGQEDEVNSNSIFMEEPELNKTTDVKYPDDSLETHRVVNIEELKLNQTKLTDSAQKEIIRPVCNMIKLRPLSFSSPRTLPEIVAQLKQWTEESPIVHFDDITAGNLTTMENPIYVMIVDDPSAGQVASEKHNVMLVAGINGRDHHAVTAAMFLLQQLIERNGSHRGLLTKYRFYVIPVFNPDGYDYSMTFPDRRDWVKNLRQNWEECPAGHDACKQCSTHGIRCVVSSCYGVNLDRNFEYQWIETTEPPAVRPAKECGALYPGPRQMSEVETQALNKYLDKHHLNLVVFIAFKEGDVLGVMYPYSHTKKRRAFDQLYRYSAHRAALAANRISSRSYVAGQTSEYLPLYAGGIEDWADGHLGIDDTYTIMLFRPKDTSKFKNNTEIVSHEAFAAIDSLLQSSLLTSPQTGNKMVLSNKNYVRLRSTSLQSNFITVSLAFVTSFLITYL